MAQTYNKRKVYVPNRGYIPDMYSSDGEETPLPTPPTIGSGVKSPYSKGIVTELEINGKKVELINAEYIRELQKTIQDLTSKLRAAERNINTMSNTIRKLVQTVNGVSTQLDNKIDRP